jgi:hypothetical protein
MRRRRRNSIDLLGVEHMCDKHLRAFQANLFGARLSIGIKNRADFGILDFALLIKAPVLHPPAFFAPANLIALDLRSSNFFWFVIVLHHTLRSRLPRASPSGSDTEEILWQPVMMPSGDLYPGIDYWMSH